MVLGLSAAPSQLLHLPAQPTRCQSLQKLGKSRPAWNSAFCPRGAMMPSTGRKDSDATPSPKHLAWMINGRAANQHATLRLYGLFDAHPERLKDFHFRAQDLVAVSFSLWRAVFLADRTGKMEVKDAQAKLFMAKMLTDNAITFAQDRSAREFSFNYYLGNARYRLQKCGEKWPSVQECIGKAATNARGRWDILQEGFGEAVRCLEADLTAEPKPRLRRPKAVLDVAS
jgi:hypothetical protein